MAFLKVGSKAPEFGVADQDGKIVKLADFKGKKVVLYFYPKDATPTCTTEACNLRDNYQALQRAGYVVLGVSTDTAKSHQKFIAKEKLPFSLLADTERKMHDAYGTWVEKSMYGKAYMGTARVTYIIDEKGVIQEVIEKVESKIHASQILGEVATKPVKTVASKANPVKKAAKKTVKKTAKKAVKKAAKKTTRKK
ncbi:MAG: thioredoxin-dependent thiol peroxidase [Cytophagia bacterium]|nr:thioredoxin-dependent thiol peroxidase [Cytophagia bacterium]